MSPSDLAVAMVFIDLFANMVALALTAKKFDILENLFLLHWKKSAMTQLFTILGFSVWFFFRALEPALPAIEDNELLFLFPVLLFFFMAHVLLLSILWGGSSYGKS